VADHLPTFRQTKEKRVKIKPVGVIAIAIVVIALIGGMAMGLNALSGRSRIKPLTAADVEAQRAAASRRKVWWQSKLRVVADPITGKEYLMAPEQVVQEVVSYLQEITERDGVEWAYEVKDFSPDGLECTLGVLEDGGKVLLYRMQYAQDQRWQIVSLLYAVKRA
jgi:hypothetical protein